MCNQRGQYRLLKRNIKSLLSNERVVQLEKKSFQWIYYSQLIPNTAWNENLYELLGFKKQWGHRNVPSKYAQFPKLGNWVRHQRHQYILLNSGKKSLIRYEKIVHLENATFQWIPDSQLICKTAWNEQIS